MKLSENVETKTSEVKASNSRASRMARYSAAAAGVAAVSSIEVDAAMIKVVVTDPDAQNTDSYRLDLGHIATGAFLDLSQSASNFSASVWGGTPKTGFVATSSLSLKFFSNGETIGQGGSWYFYEDTLMSSGSGLFGFRVERGSSDYTYGWFKATIDGASALTLNSYGYNSTLNEAATAGEGNVVPDSGPGIVGLALIGAGAAGVRLLRKLRAGE